MTEDLKKALEAVDRELNRLQKEKHDPRVIVEKQGDDNHFLVRVLPPQKEKE